MIRFECRLILSIYPNTVQALFWINIPNTHWRKSTSHDLQRVKADATSPSPFQIAGVPS
jgi:hypothetical protein